MLNRLQKFIKSLFTKHKVIKTHDDYMMDLLETCEELERRVNKKYWYQLSSQANLASQGKLDIG